MKFLGIKRKMRSLQDITKCIISLFINNQFINKDINKYSNKDYRRDRNSLQKVSEWKEMG